MTDDLKTAMNQMFHKVKFAKDKETIVTKDGKPVRFQLLRNGKPVSIEQALKDLEQPHDRH